MPNSIVYIPIGSPVPHPNGSGYGGVGWDPLRSFSLPLTPEGDALQGYGLVSYGSRTFPATPIPVDGGYGGDPYGLGPYGGVEKLSPRLSSAVSLNGWEIEVFFSEEMDPGNSALLDPASYVLIPSSAAPSTVTSVRVEQLGAFSVRDHFRGVLSVILTHTGTTLGGAYQILATGPKDVSGNEVLGATVSLLTLGEAPAYTVAAISGDELLFTFSHPMLTAAEEPLGGPGILDAASYDFSSVPVYPVTIRPQTVTHPYLGDVAKVHQQVVGMTSLAYTCNISPATAISYDGSTLPDQATSFMGLEVYPGNGQSSIVGGKLVITKAKVIPYGWAFLASSGVTTSSSFRVDVVFNVGAAVYTPPLSAYANLDLATLTVADGPPGLGTQLRITLRRIPGGLDQLLIESDMYVQTVLGTWSTGDVTLSVVRNQKGGFYSILLGGYPIATTPIGNITENSTLAAAGVRWLLLPSLTNITGFQFLGVQFQATATVWSGAWNFMHNVQSGFGGSDDLTRKWLLTQRGPLVKDWGDMTPATKQDVEVRVNGVAVEIEDVNPYWGKVTLVVPVPLLPPGDPQADVQVDYHWFPTPILPMDGLNVEGATLNKWDRATGHHDPAGHGEQVQDATHPKGAVDISRFPMGVVLGPPDRPEPLLISHRYIGFEKSYSALLNSPTTMLLNQDPKVSQVPAFNVPTEGVTVSYEGTVIPSQESWTLTGADAGRVNGDGTYTVYDDQSGPYDPANPKVAMYWREVDLSYPSSLYLVGRFRMPVAQPHGVFTGVGFGAHDNHHVYMAGALKVPSTTPGQAAMMHVGLLRDPTMMHLLDGWFVGPTVTGTIQDRTTVTASGVPTGFTVGSRFQIVSGSQAGFYSVASIIRHSTGVAEIMVSAPFPADPKLYGNKYFDLLFEVDWVSDPSTFRLVVDSEQRTATLDVSGRISGRVAALDGAVAHMPQPSQTSLLLSTDYRGQIFWGSLDSFAVSSSAWSFLRYGVVPDQTAIRGYVQVVNTEMSDLPDEDPTNEWFQTESFGHSKILMTGGMLLKSTSGSSSYQESFGYSRIEPFMSPGANLDLRAQFKMDSGVLGAGDALIEILDGQRVVRLGTLLYYEGGSPWRQLVQVPVISAAGFMDPETQGWAYLGVGGGVVSRVTQGPDTTMVVPVGQSSRFQGLLDVSGMVSGDSGDRLCDLQVASDTAGYLFTLSSLSGHTINLYLRGGATPGVQLVTETSVVVQEYDFDWTDGELHTYRLAASNGVATLFLDDDLQIPTVGMAPFATGGSDQLLFGSYNTTATTTTRWRSVSYSALPPAWVKRTLGIWLGGDKDDINQWQIPRSDASTEPNSAQVGPVIEEMDWRNVMEVRLLRTDGWGVTMLRPDLPLPPYYQPETPGVPGSGYATQAAVPSAGWVNVEEVSIPRLPSTFGSVSFGALDQRSVTQQRWDWVRYKIFKTFTEEHKSPEHMVLNQANVVTSGEFLLDVTMETVTVPVLNSSSVSLIPSHIRAGDVYRVNDGVQDFYRTSWSFDVETQVLNLTGGRQFASSTVTVVFKPGLPVTTTYLLNQPVLDGMTLLNEGTPPVPKSQGEASQREEVYGSFLNNPNQILNQDPGFTLNDPYHVVTFTDDSTSLYDSMKFMEVDNGGETGLISTPSEGLLPQGFSGFSPTEGENVYSKDGTGEPLNGVGQCADLKATGTKVGEATGAHVLGLKGPLFTERAAKPKSDPFEQGGGMPGKTLFASGGNFVGPIVNSAGKIIPGKKPLGGTLGPGTAILYPNFTTGRVKAGTGSGGIYRRTDWFLRLHSVLVGRNGQEQALIETLDMTEADNTPSSRPASWRANPSGTPAPNGLGAALAEMTGAGNFSHLGPWGGAAALSAARDSGTFEFQGATVPVGYTVEVRNETTLTVVTFTAVAVPAAPNEFDANVTPHVSLANAINQHVVVSTWVEATSGITWAGYRAVLVEARLPVTVLNLLAIVATPPLVRVTGVLGDNASGLLTGGAKITQSSLAAGGTVTVPYTGAIAGLHNPLRGFLCEGGNVLPAGVATLQVLQSP